MENNCWPRSSIKIFIVCVYGSDYILGNCNNWNGSHRPNGCWGLEFYKSPWTEKSLYSSHLKLHKFRCDQKRDGKNLFLPLLNLLPIVLLSQQCLRTLFLVNGWFTSFTEKLPFFIYVVDFYILLKYGIATLSDFVNEKKGSRNQSRAYPFPFGIYKRFFTMTKVSNIISFRHKHLYPTFFS